MKKELLIALAKRLHSELNKPALLAKYGKLAYIARFRNQFNNAEETIPPLAVALEFPPSIYHNRAKQTQEVEHTIRVHLHMRQLEKQRLDASGLLIAGTKELDYLQEIHKVLHGWAPAGFTTLVRLDEAEDVNYDFALTDTISYGTTGTDSSADKRSEQEEISVDLEINEDVIPPPVPLPNPYDFRF